MQSQGGSSYRASDITERTYPQNFWAPDSTQVDCSGVLLWLQLHDFDLLCIHTMQRFVVDLTAGVITRRGRI